MNRLITIVLATALFFAAAPSVGAGKNADEEYAKAKACYGELKSDAVKAKEHGEWERCISLFEKFHAKNKDATDSATAAYNAGKLGQELYLRQHRLSDAEDAIKAYNVVVNEYPKNPLADDALYQIGRLRHDPLKQDDKAKCAFTYITENYPNGDMAGKAKEELELLALPRDGAVGDGAMAGPRNPAALVSVDVEKGADETKVILNLSRRAAYSVDFTEFGRRTKSPPKLDLLLVYTKPAELLEKKYNVSSPELSNIKVRKDFLKGGTRLIFEMAPNSFYDVDAGGDKITLKFKKAKAKSEKKGAAATQKKFVIVIDPGHGGSDAGAIGPTGLEEKTVTLAVSKLLASKLEKAPTTKVYLTRTKDKNLTLEERNAFAVSKKTDIFVSIHANAAKNRKMTGIETYFLNNASDAAAEKLAKRENSTAKKKLSDVEHILSTMLQNYDAEESRLLAGDVHASLMRQMGKRYKGIKNRSVRSALFYVLVGAKCPAILVETSFISNPQEEKRLASKSYRDDLAGAIASGILKYVKTNVKT